VAGRDITDDIPLDIGQPTLPSNIWFNTGTAFDVAIGGQPFIYATSEERPYERATAPYRKQQFDNSQEPGEQSLTGWWIRSQSSFHRGAGIKFYDPSAGEEVEHRFETSKGVNVWTPGQATLLREVTQGHQTTGEIALNGVTQQHLRSIEWTTDSITYEGALMLDEFDVDKIFPEITASINNKELTSDVATLTTTAAHGFCTGMEVVVTDVDATFDGTFRITSVPTTTTFTYAKVATGVVSTAVSPVGTATSQVIHFVDYTSGPDFPVYGMCDDGTNGFWVTNVTSGGSNNITVYKKALSLDASTSGTPMFDDNFQITNAVMEYVKNRIVMAADNKVYEFSASAVAMPTAVYTNPSAGHVYTSITASGAAIYLAGYNGIQSTIEKFILSSTGTMPTLSSAITAAELPTGEIVQAIHYYLGYMLIGTSKGVRVAAIKADDGSLTYGPLIVETTQPVYGFATRGRFAWATTGVDGNPGTIRIDLSEQISPLVFAYANDVYKSDVTGKVTTAVSFLGETDRVIFATANGYSYLEDATELLETGFIQTGRIRYATLEPKNYKRLVGKGDFTSGSMTLNTVDVDGLVYDILSYDSAVGAPEVSTNVPQGPLEFLRYRFDLNRDTVDTTTGPVFQGYQIKALPASTRQRLVQLPLFCFDVEQDRFNNENGYQGRAFERIVILETLEETGDEVTFQDFTTNEQFGCVIEEVSFRKISPPDRRFSGFGGILNVVIRKL
jgi:hypothetical protein